MRLEIRNISLCIWTRDKGLPTEVNRFRTIFLLYSISFPLRFLLPHFLVVFKLYLLLSSY